MPRTRKWHHIHYHLSLLQKQPCPSHYSHHTDYQCYDFHRTLISSLTGPLFQQRTCFATSTSAARAANASCPVAFTSPASSALFTFYLASTIACPRLIILSRAFCPSRPVLAPLLGIISMAKSDSGLPNAFLHLRLQPRPRHDYLYGIAPGRN